MLRKSLRSFCAPVGRRNLSSKISDSKKPKNAPQKFVAVEGMEDFSEFEEAKLFNHYGPLKDFKESKPPSEYLRMTGYEFVSEDDETDLPAMEKVDPNLDPNVPLTMTNSQFSKIRRWRSRLAKLPQEKAPTSPTRWRDITPGKREKVREQMMEHHRQQGKSFLFEYDPMVPGMELANWTDKMKHDPNTNYLDHEGLNTGLDFQALGLVRQIVNVDKVQKTTTQGNILQFRALVIVGNQNGVAGYAVAKALNVPLAIERATAKAQKRMISIDRFDNRTLYHEVRGKFNSCTLFLRPGKSGSGLTVSDRVGAVLYCFGLVDVVSKTLGQRNPFTVIKAVFDALSKHESAEDYAMKTGRSVYELHKEAKHRLL